MGRSDTFRAGQRVRIRPYVDSDFAGFQGVILFVGDDVCDVKIKYRPKGSKVSSTYIGTFKKQDLETRNSRMNLAHFSHREDRRRHRPLIWLLVFVTLLFVLGFTVNGLH